MSGKAVAKQKKMNHAGWNWSWQQLWCNWPYWYTLSDTLWRKRSAHAVSTLFVCMLFIDSLFDPTLIVRTLFIQTLFVPCSSTRCSTGWPCLSGNWQHCVWGAGPPAVRLSIQHSTRSMSDGSFDDLSFRERIRQRGSCYKDRQEAREQTLFPNPLLERWIPRWMTDECEPFSLLGKYSIWKLPNHFKMTKNYEASLTTNRARAKLWRSNFGQFGLQANFRRIVRWQWAVAHDHMRFCIGGDEKSWGELRRAEESAWESPLTMSGWMGCRRFLDRFVCWLPRLVTLIRCFDSLFWLVILTGRFDWSL